MKWIKLFENFYVNFGTLDTNHEDNLVRYDKMLNTRIIVSLALINLVESTIGSINDNIKIHDLSYHISIRFNNKPIVKINELKDEYYIVDQEGLYKHYNPNDKMQEVIYIDGLDNIKEYLDHLRVIIKSL